MTSSDSQPIQFWADGVETFNEKDVCGLVKQDCFCQIFQTDDTITVQIRDTGEQEYILRVKAYDNTDTVVGSVGMDKETNHHTASFSPSDIGMVAGSQYILKIERMDSFPAVSASFILTGNDAALNFNNDLQMIAETGTFALTGIDATLTLTIAYLYIQANKVTGTSNRFKSTFAGSASEEIILTGTSDYEEKTIAFGASTTYIVTVSKTLPADHLAEADGWITFSRNGIQEPGSGPIGGGTGAQSFVVGDNLNAVTYTFTGLAPGDTVLTDVLEG